MGDINLDQYVQQIAFPGDPNPGSGLPAVPAVTTWLSYNGNDAGAPDKIWEQTVINLKSNKDYAFTAYFSNAMAPGQQAKGFVAPQVSFRVNGVAVGSPITVCDAGGALDPLQGDCANEATKDTWQRLGVTINPGAATTAKLSVHDVHPNNGAGGNDFSMTLISFQECVPIGTPDIDVTIGGQITTTVNFPAFTLGGTATSQTITVTNKGTGNLVLGTIAAPANTDFAIVTDNCSGKSLAAAKTCTLVMNFSSATAGTKTGTLSIPSNDADENPLALALKGTAGAVIDTDKDGVPDNIDRDDDNDGILDTEEGNGDFDGDGVPNHLDLDTDNDTIPDIREALGSDVDNDGRVDNFLDSNGDGYHDALDTTPWARPDTDGDGNKDYRDINSDNDDRYDIVEVGIADVNNDGIVDNFTDPDGDGWDRGKFVAVLGAGGTLPDSDGDGIPDYRQGIGEVLTRLDGGVGGLGLPLGLSLFAAGALRRRRLLAATTLLSLGTMAQAEQGQFYLGAGIGMSQLEPDVVNLPLKVDDKEDLGFKLFLGYDILDWLSIEGFGARLGAAGFSNGGEIDYDVLGAGLVFNLPHNSPGISFLGKIGYAQIDNSGTSNVPFREVEGHEIYAGLGAEYQFDNNFSLRGEYEYFDKDAQLISLSLLKRFGEEEAYAPPPVVPAPAPSVVEVEEPAPIAPPKPQMITLDIESVFFATDSSALTAEARTRLNRFAAMLQTYPQVKLTAIGHTDNRASDDYNMGLSLARAKSTVNYLISQGIDASRLRYEARGEKEPIADNRTEEGRAQNRRVDFIPEPGQVEKAK
jgi:outer membrane protein OmpA-like peptidoglycan-associated protein